MKRVVKLSRRQVTPTVTGPGKTCERGIVRPVRPITTPAGLTVVGRKDGIVLYVKADSPRMMKEFNHFLRQFGCDAKPVQNLGPEGGTADAFEILASPEALDLIKRQPFVVAHHDIDKVPTPRGGSGAGEIGHNAYRAERERKRPKTEQVLIALHTERAKLPAERRDMIEATEAGRVPLPTANQRFDRTAARDGVKQMIKNNPHFTPASERQAK